VNFFILDKPIQIINIINIILSENLKKNSNILIVINNFKNSYEFSTDIRKIENYFSDYFLLDEISDIKFIEKKNKIYLPRIYDINLNNNNFYLNKYINDIFLYDEGMGSYLNKFEVKNFIPHKKYKILIPFVNLWRYFIFKFTFLLSLLKIKKYFHFKYFYNLIKFKIDRDKFKGIYLYNRNAFLSKNPKSNFKIFNLKFTFNDLALKYKDFFYCFHDTKFNQLKNIKNKKILIILPDWIINEEKVVKIIENNREKYDYIIFKGHTNNLNENEIPQKILRQIDISLNSGLPAEIIVNFLLNNENNISIYHDNSAIALNYIKIENSNLDFSNYGCFNHSFNELIKLFANE